MFDGLSKSHNYVGKGIQNTVKYFEAVSKIVEISPEHGEYKEQLRKILNIICDMPWMSMRTSASVFLVSDNPCILELYSHVGLSANTIETCNKVNIDLCMSGLAAKTGKMIFKTSIQKEDCPYVNQDNLTNRGQYSVPIKYNHRILGVLNINVHEGHNPNDLEIQFLTDISTTLSLLIKNHHLMKEIQHMDNKFKRNRITQ
ncbi:hypothetical protein [Candidatus Magnetominusculus dajiuhuensis]|uniref:hypothetical protein n=1 Tax=Candidatus Magnetominusculus dajiuhuensis TaxID=3137712 RepID=UPI003B43D5E5